MIDEELKAQIESAAKFHGHLGPFLVIGIRMGNLARSMLNLNAAEIKELRVNAKVLLLTPFSCVLDGLQVTTQCTLGNQKLRIENSQREITVHFQRQSVNPALKVSVNPKTVEALIDRQSEGVSNEELAWEIAQMPESRLFTIEKQ